MHDRVGMAGHFCKRCGADYLDGGILARAANPAVGINRFIYITGLARSVKIQFFFEKAASIGLMTVGIEMDRQ